MTPVEEEFVAHVRDKFPDRFLGHREYRRQVAVTVRAGRIVEVLRSLKEHPELAFVRLSDLCGVDYLDRNEPERFAVVYHLHSFRNNLWVRVRAMVPEREPVIDSAHPLWACAEWLEREAFDLYGIRFRHHPDLRRILMPDDYPAHPLRKDYPVRGQGERNRFPVYQASVPAPGAAEGAVPPANRAAP